MSNITILNKLDDNKFLVQVKPNKLGNAVIRSDKIFMAHDYASFESSIYATNVDKSTNFDFRAFADIHVPVKSFIEVVLPYFNKHKYCQPEHLKDRVHTEDSIGFKEGTNELSFKKGDIYPAYAYQNHAVYYWDDNQFMVSFQLKGEKNFSTVTAKIYEEYILPNIKL